MVFSLQLHIHLLRIMRRQVDSAKPDIMNYVGLVSMAPNCLPLGPLLVKYPVV